MRDDEPHCSAIHAQTGGQCMFRPGHRRPRKHSAFVIRQPDGSLSMQPQPWADVGGTVIVRWEDPA